MPRTRTVSFMTQLFEERVIKAKLSDECFLDQILKMGIYVIYM